MFALDSPFFPLLSFHVAANHESRDVGPYVSRRLPFCRTTNRVRLLVASLVQAITLSHSRHAFATLLFSRHLSSFRHLPGRRCACIPLSVHALIILQVLVRASACIPPSSLRLIRDPQPTCDRYGRRSASHSSVSHVRRSSSPGPSVVQPVLLSQVRPPPVYSIASCAYTNHSLHTSAISVSQLWLLLRVRMLP